MPDNSKNCDFLKALSVCKFKDKGNNVLAKNLYESKKETKQNFAIKSKKMEIISPSFRGMKMTVTSFALIQKDLHFPNFYKSFASLLAVTANKPRSV